MFVTTGTQLSHRIASKGVGHGSFSPTDFEYLKYSHDGNFGQGVLIVSID